MLNNDELFADGSEMGLKKRRLIEMKCDKYAWDILKEKGYNLKKILKAMKNLLDPDSPYISGKGTHPRPIKRYELAEIIINS